jgi:hypothetical protein
MAPKTIIKNFNAFQGVDLRSSDLVRSPDAYIEFQNAVKTRDSSVTNRQGSKRRTSKFLNYLGEYRYAYSDANGAIQEELLTLGSSLHKITKASLTITYSGSATLCYFSILFDETANLQFKIVEEGVGENSFSLGTGNESGYTELSTFVSWINGLTNFTATLSGFILPGGTVAADVLPIVEFLDLTAAPNTQTLELLEYTPVNDCFTGGNVFQAYFDASGSDSFEHASIVNASNCMFLATGHEFLHVYDGQTVYRAGMPESTTPTMLLGGAGAVTGTYRYLTTHVFIDNRNNRTEGVESNVSNTISPSSQMVTVTATNIITDSGYNTNCAIVSGNQTGVTTINTTASNTMQVGDTAYFLDRSTGEYVTRKVTARSAGTIAIEGAAVNVNNNDVISNNLRIAIYRTKNGGIEYFLVEEIPNNSFAATQTYSDNKIDSALGLQYLFPIDGFENDVLTAKPKYLTLHQNQLIAAGDPTNPDTIFISLPGDPFSFPAVSGVVDIISTKAGGISGLASDQTVLIVGKEDELFIGSGDFSEPGQYRFERTNNTIGFACHNAIQQIGEGIIFLSKQGFYRIRGSRVDEIGEPINKLFFDKAYTDSQILRLKRSWTCFINSAEKLFCYIPCESGNSPTTKFANSNSKLIVYDSYFGSWSFWTGLNCGGGLTDYQNKMWWNSKREDVSTVTRSNVSSHLDNGNLYDYADDGIAIQTKVHPQWEDGGEPSVFKKILRVKIYNMLKDVLQPTFSMSVKTEIDYQYGATHSDFVADFGSVSSLGYGYGSWGIFAWGSPATIFKTYKLRNSKVKTLRFLFEHNRVNEKFAISGWEYEMVAAYRKEMK